MLQNVCVVCVSTYCVNLLLTYLAIQKEACLKLKREVESKEEEEANKKQS